MMGVELDREEEKIWEKESQILVVVKSLGKNDTDHGRLGKMWKCDIILPGSLLISDLLVPKFLSGKN